MSVIFIVTAVLDYEGFDLIKAFNNKSCASAFLDDVVAYQKTRPKGSYMQPGFKFRLDAWVDGHPAGNHWDVDGYSIETVEMVIKN